MTFDFAILNSILDQFQAVARVWYANIYPYSLRFVALLATIELAWSAGRLIISRDTGLATFFELYLRKLVYLTFVATLVAFAGYWMPLIPSGFVALATKMTGLSTLHPSGFFSTGIYLAVHIMTLANVTGLFTGPLSAIGTMAVAYAVFAAFAVMAGALLFALIEVALYVGGMSIMLAFAATRWTHQLAESYITSVIRLGVRLMVLYLLIGVVYQLTLRWASMLVMASATPGLAIQLALLAAVWIAATLILAVPRSVAHALVPTTLHLGLSPAVGDN